jgi:fatty acid amide hydrolase
VTVKECFHVTGTPSTVGLETKRDLLAQEDAELITRLRAAGAIVVAKTNVSQFLIYGESDNPVYGRTNNPWNLARSPGGSSGGEGAAVAAGYACLGLGTDIGGSLRIPAHFCGVHALRPTPDRLSLCGTEDEVLFRYMSIPDAAGPLARTVADLRLAMSALGSPIPEAELKRMRIGFYFDNGIFPVSAAIKRAVTEAAHVLESAGCDVREASPPDAAEGLRLFYSLAADGAGTHLKSLLKGSAVDPRVKDLLTLVSLPNTLRPLVAALYGLRGERRVAALVHWGRRLSEPESAALRARRDAFRERLRKDLGKFDALICPPSAIPAVTHGASRTVDLATFSYTSLYNVLGWPAGVVAVSRVRRDEEIGRLQSRDRVEETARKVDLGSEGLPIGVQVAALPERDDLVLSVMEALEAHFRTQPDYPLTPVTPPT